jgi:YD repeat-containing protein
MNPTFCRMVTLTCVMASMPAGARQHGAAGEPLAAPTYAAMDGDPVDLSTGLYVRTTVDLVLVDTIPVVFARTYRNRDSRSRAFGIGTNHSFGTFLVGDAATFSYVDLILADGGRIHFRRTSDGIGFTDAIFEHTGTPTEYQDSYLFWEDGGWTIQLADGGAYTYPACSPWLNKPCTVSSYRDSDGNEVRMRHDRRMNLIRIEAQHGAAIDLAYDREDRIVLARSTYGQQVRYEYDGQGRLVRVTNADGSKTAYGYDEHHQMIQVDEAGLSVTNTFDDAGRCVVNDVRTEVLDDLGGTQTRRDVFKFAYTVDGTGRITATEVERPTGRRTVTFNQQGYRLTDSEKVAGGAETRTAFDRNDASNVVQRLVVWCGPQDSGVKVEAEIDPAGSIESIRRQLQAKCDGYVQMPTATTAAQ